MFEVFSLSICKNRDHPFPKHASLAAIFFLCFLLPHWAFSENSCNPKAKVSVELLSETALDLCRKTKESPQCQNLYKKIKEEGLDPKEKELKCEVDTDLTLSQKVSVSYISCLKGGIVDGIISPIKEIGKWIGESTAKGIIAIKNTNERLQLCNKNLNTKREIFRIYNSSVPKLMRINAPSDLSKKSCAQLEQELYSLSNQTVIPYEIF